MKIITCASYGGSGSSALTDLVAEYSTVKSLSDYEFRFLHDPNGISDLEFQLIECHNRHNSGHALKRFWNFCKFNAGNKFHQRYEPFFHNRYLQLSEQYVRELTDFTNKEFWYYDLLEKGERYYYFKRAEAKLLKLITFGKIGILQNEITLFSHPTQERFLRATQKYISALLTAANQENLPFIAIDQIVPSQNIDRYLRYFNEDIDVFVVNRDPRDMYVLQTLYWDGKGYDNAHTFCQKYRYDRESGDSSKSVSPKIHRIQFEDLIFKYTEMVSLIENKTGLSASDHCSQFKLFNPKRSIHNTQTWKDHPELQEDIKVIEKQLEEFLYPFEKNATNRIEGIDSSNTDRF